MVTRVRKFFKHMFSTPAPVRPAQQLTRTILVNLPGGNVRIIEVA